MTESEMLEAEKYWCENCGNFDKEHRLPDGYAKCKLTGTMAYSEECGKDCKFFNVPAENVIVLPDLKHRQNLYFLYKGKIKVLEFSSYHIKPEFNNIIQINAYKSGFNGCCNADDIGKTVFLTKEEAKKAIKEREG